MLIYTNDLLVNYILVARDGIHFVRLNMRYVGNDVFKINVWLFVRCTKYFPHTIHISRLIGDASG